MAKMRNKMRYISISIILIGLFTGRLAAQEEAVNKAMEKDDSKDLKMGDVAPSWALMYAPGKFEFLKNWSEEEGKRLRKFTSQPDRNAVVMSFFATWCQPCMKELPLLEEVYQKYKDERIKFFLVDITEATRTIPGNENLPKAGPFLKEKGVTMQILYDTRGTVMKRYNAQTLPRLFLMDGNRKITLTRRGFHEGEEEKFKKDLSVELERLLANLPPAKNKKE
ncbi:MAG: TlpA disulfide reductase family protein [Rhodospirillales bacterium]|jgi:thiol-disulfide isomerase/thioredoxin